MICSDYQMQLLIRAARQAHDAIRIMGELKAFNEIGDDVTAIEAQWLSRTPQCLADAYRALQSALAGGIMHNPGLNLPYEMHPGHDNIRVAHGWTAWWLLVDPEGNEADQPEYKPLTPDVDGHRVLEGDASQCWFIRWRRMSGGIAQSMNALAGRRVTVRVPFHVWCSQSDDPTRADGELYARVGIDPHGRADPESDDVEWGQWVRGTREWGAVALSTTAVEDRVTVYVHAWNKWELSHNDIYVDDITYEAEGVEPEPPEPPEPEGGEWVVDLRVTGTIRRPGSFAELLRSRLSFE